MLTEREIEMLRWTSFGKTYGEVAMIVGLSRHTVKNHVQRILKKLHCSNAAHAVRLGFEQGLLSAQDRPV